LRPHQRDGIVWLCRGIGGELVEGHGAVLADVPGLGKSAQIIGTLLASSSWVKKLLIVCPVSLVDNWIAEFQKWAPEVQVGSEQNAAAALPLALTPPPSPSNLQTQPPYERMRGDAQKLLSRANINLIVCDEAHRLKNSTTQYARSRRACHTAPVTGTPVQNNAGEFWAMTNLALPGVLGSLWQFKSKYEMPMACGQMDNVLLRQLQRDTNSFVLRRGEDILRQWLPRRRELLVFCKITATQRELYVDEIAQWSSTRLDGARPSAHSLVLLHKLQKIIAHPCLVTSGRGADEPNIDLMLSGKLIVTRSLLRAIHAQTDEKVLLTSNNCYTLDLLQRLARANRWPYLRVDGKVNGTKRQELIDEFNSSPRSSHFLFLLSAKAGGAGLNITGASRLIIFEPAWNPAVDAQVCGRIWRLGQEREVSVFKLFGTSTVDELIVQRQMSKTEISDMI
ncbi:P-loop containing nucleoside triphosphate hydrolase protein, partial [Pavlovales sp. CCMP2436]